MESPTSLKIYLSKKWVTPWPAEKSLSGHIQMHEIFYSLPVGLPTVEKNNRVSIGQAVSILLGGFHGLIRSAMSRSVQGRYTWSRECLLQGITKSEMGGNVLEL